MKSSDTPGWKKLHREMVVRLRTLKDAKVKELGVVAKYPDSRLKHLLAIRDLEGMSDSALRELCDFYGTTMMDLCMPDATTGLTADNRRKMAKLNVEFLTGKIYATPYAIARKEIESQPRLVRRPIKKVDPKERAAEEERLWAARSQATSWRCLAKIVANRWREANNRRECPIDVYGYLSMYGQAHFEEYFTGRMMPSPDDFRVICELLDIAPERLVAMDRKLFAAADDYHEAISASLDFAEGRIDAVAYSGRIRVLIPQKRVEPGDPVAICPELKNWAKGSYLALATRESLTNDCVKLIRAYAERGFLDFKCVADFLKKGAGAHWGRLSKMLYPAWEIACQDVTLGLTRIAEPDAASILGEPV